MLHQFPIRGSPGIADIPVQQEQGCILYTAQQPSQRVQGGALLSLIVHQEVIEQLKNLQTEWTSYSGRNVMFKAGFLIMTQGERHWAGQIITVFGLRAPCRVEPGARTDLHTAACPQEWCSRRPVLEHSRSLCCHQSEHGPNQLLPET